MGFSWDENSNSKAKKSAFHNQNQWFFSVAATQDWTLFDRLIDRKTSVFTKPPILFSRILRCEILEPTKVSLDTAWLMPKTTSSLRCQHTYPGPVKHIYSNEKKPGILYWAIVPPETQQGLNLIGGAISIRVGPEFGGESRQFFLRSLLPQKNITAKCLKICQCAKPMTSPASIMYLGMATIYLKLLSNLNWRHFGKHFHDKTTFTCFFPFHSPRVGWSTACSGKILPNNAFNSWWNTPCPNIGGESTYSFRRKNETGISDPSFCPSMFLAVPASPLNPASRNGTLQWQRLTRANANKNLSCHAILVVFCS